MILHLMLASTVGQIFKPLYELLAGIIAFFYSVIPNFAIAIALLTVVVMIVTAPLTVKSTKSTIAMQRVAPELKKIQAKYKGDRVTLNEEMMKLYKEHGINPAGGCLPMLVQLPVFVVLYGVIRGLTSTVKGKNGVLHARPDYVSHGTRLYRDLIASNGHMKAFGLDLGNNLFSHHSSWLGAIPYGAIVAIAIGLQYLQMRQLNSRNPGAAAANPQMQMMQRYMPLIIAVIYIRISAGVNIYFVVSSLCRIGIQEGIFRSGVLNKTPTRREGRLPSRDGGGAAPRRSIMEKLADAQQRALEQQKARQAPLQAEIDKPRLPKEIGPGAKPTGTKPSGAKPSGGKPAGTKPPGTKANGAPTREDSSVNGGAASNEDGSSNRSAQQNGSARAGGAAKSNGAGKPAGAAKRPGGASTNGGAQRGSTKAGSNGSPAPKEQPSGQPRSAKKRPRKAR
jgi:YidC/Oxa1 family membrane protein insertase